MEHAVAVKNLAKYYDDLLAVDHIDFEVKNGEIFGSLGPNGAGKTTTIRMLTGLTKPSEGTAKIFGHDIKSDTVAAKRNIGMIPETRTFVTIFPLRAYPKNKFVEVFSRLF
jgi:ABC-2 type transport system ATP-binding protein